MRRGHPLAAKRALSLDAYLSARHARVSFTGRAHDYADEAWRASVASAGDDHRQPVPQRRVRRPPVRTC